MQVFCYSTSALGDINVNEVVGHEIVGFFTNILGFEIYDKEAAQLWLNTDGNNPGFQNLNRQNFISYSKEREGMDSKTSDNDESKEPTQNESSNKESFAALEMVSWWEWQEKYILVNYLRKDVWYDWRKKDKNWFLKNEVITF